jgi:hypothetical protein
MDRCDEDRPRFAWRDGGFISYLPDRDGWSPCFTRQDGLGDTPPLSVCNAHNDFHIKFIIRNLPEKNGKFHLHMVHRLLTLPPEITAYVWDHVRLIQQNGQALVIKIGEVEDFEHQPVPLTQPARGLVWTSNEPRLMTNTAHSGRKSLVVKGRTWPNLPQVSLKPSTRYRLEGWFKVAPWTAEQIAAEKKKDADQRAELAKKGKPLPPEVAWDKLAPKAYIRGDYYEWSPYTGPILQEQQTTSATGQTGDWQHVVLDFTTPDWAPFINIAFHADYCEAYLDDFALRERPDASSKPEQELRPTSAPAGSATPPPPPRSGPSP